MPASPPDDQPRKKRWKRRALFCLAGLVGLLVVAIAGAVFGLRGRTAGRLVTAVLADVLPGKMKIDAIWWEGRILLDLLIDARTPIVLEGVELYDPEGTLVMALPRLELTAPPRSAIGAHVKLHDVKIGPGSYWLFGDQKQASGNGFLSALIPPSPPKTTPAPAAPARPTQATPAAAKGGGFVFQIVNADLDGLTAEFDFPGSWGLRLANILGKANLTIDGDFVGFDAWDLDARDGGYLIVLTEKLPFDRVHVTRVATLREYRNDIFLEVKAGHTGRSVLIGKGFFTHIYDDEPPGIAMHAEMAHAADALNAVAAPHLPDIGPLVISGDEAFFKADLNQPFDRITIDGVFRNLDVDYDGRTARDLKFDLEFQAAPLRARLADFSFADPEGGRLELGTVFEDRGVAGGPPDLRLDLDIGLQDFHTRSYLPPALLDMLAGRVDGRVQVQADLQNQTAVAHIPRLQLRRARARGMPRLITVQGRATASPDVVETSGLQVTVPGATARAQGRVELGRNLLALSLRAVANDLPLALQPFGMPPLAKRAEIEARVDGRIDNPTVQGRADVMDIALPAQDGTPLPGIPHLQAQFGLKNGVARLDRLQAALLGGKIGASGQAEIYRGSIDRLLRAPIVDLRVHGKQARLQDILGATPIGGAISFEAQAKGSINRLSGHLALPDDTQLLVLGEPWALSGLQIQIEDRHLTLSTTRLSRADGGAVSLQGRMALQGPMDMHWDLVVEDFPLQALAGLADTGVSLAGTLNAQLVITGSVQQPSATGQIRVSGVTVNQAHLGDIDLHLQARHDQGVPGVDLQGRVFDLFDLKASGGLAAAGPQGSAVVSFEGLALESLLPQVLAVLNDGSDGMFGLPEAAAGVQSRLSGQVAVTLAPGQPMTIDAVLNELQLSGQAPGGTGSDRRVSLRNAGDIRARKAGDRITLETSKLVTTGGELELGGTLHGDRIEGGLRGQLDLEVLQPLLGNVVRDLSGALGVAVQASGRLPHPTLFGDLRITRPISMHHTALNAPIQIPSGTITLRPGSAGLEKLIVRVDESQIGLNGQAWFSDEFQLEKFSVDMTGALDARLLSVVAPGVIVESSGEFSVNGHVAGTLDTPNFDARLKAKDVVLRLRDLGRRIDVASADLKLTAREMLLTNVRAVVDDQGTITIGEDGAPPGRIVFDQVVPDLKIRYMMVPIRGEHLSFRSPGVFEIDDLGFTLLLTGDLNESLSLSGDVRVISGRVVWDFDVGDFVISPRIVEGYGRPAKPNPLLDNLRLDLTVRTIGDTFLVQNNLAPELYMLIDLYVGGTASRPTIAGGLRPTEGRFQIIGMRGDFDLVPEANLITFEPTKSLANLETPWLNLFAENLVTDTNGSEHVVRMRISGPVGQAQVEFSTDTGLNQNQSLLLLLSGSPTAGQTRFGTANPTLARNVNTGLDIAGQATRDVMSTLIEPYIADTLALVTGDRLALRPTIGPDGVEVRLFGRFNRQLRLQLNYLQGFQTQRRARADAGLWMADYVTLRAVAEHLQLVPQQGITETFNSLNLQLSLEYPLRFPR